MHEIASFVASYLLHAIPPPERLELDVRNPSPPTSVMRACVCYVIRRVVLMRARLSGLASMLVPHLYMHATSPFLALD